MNYKLYRAREWLARWIAGKLPRWLVYRATVRLWAETTTGKWGSTIPSTIPVEEALRRWEREGE